MNVRLIKFLFFFFILVGCGRKELISNSTQTCFYKQGDFFIVNFSNQSSDIKSITNISLISDKNFFLLDDYHHFHGDTLYIRFPNDKDVKISDAMEPNTKVINDSLIILKSKRVQQLFKVKHNFNVIKFSNNKDYIHINECNKT
ncbi:hypothetical protein [Flavobacterium rhizosphaerae]|uniref:Lipoprotein n=1 Tax=Flavobacterium rhizosphaerae TaxID=3163298 RepID=A0ABW8Z286_9FLAO